MPSTLDALDRFATLILPHPPTPGIDQCALQRLILTQRDDVMELLLVEIIQKSTVEKSTIGT